MFKIYRILSFLFIPLIFINTYLRIINKKEDIKRYKERFGKTIINKPLRKVIWIHAASVGEFKSADLIIKNYYLEYLILVTTTTKSAAEFAASHYSDKILHQYAPYDIEIWIKRFINFWRPSLVIWIESDLWPNTLSIIKKNNIRAIFLNARISPKSFYRWKFFPFFYNYILNSFSYIFAQSLEDKKRLEFLSKKEIGFIGNLKLAEQNKDSKIINKNNKSDLNIMFASTHIGEDEMIIPIINKLFNKYNNMKFYIAPRHPERSNSIIRILYKKNLDSSLESQSKKNSRITIINSFGNLKNYFSKSDIVFLGGSLTKKGGHNPVEPAQHNCAIISGKYIFNWQNVYEDMLSENACYLIDNINKLNSTIETLINNKEMLKNVKINAQNFANKKFFDEEKLKDIINSNLINNA